MFGLKNISCSTFISESRNFLNPYLGSFLISPSDEINKGISFLEFLSVNKILSSKSEARRAMENKGLKIDNVVITDENKILNSNDFKKNVLKISYGKKKHYLIKII